VHPIDPIDTNCALYGIYNPIDALYGIYDPIEYTLSTYEIYGIYDPIQCIP